MERRIAYLDGWRAIAVAGVLFAHFVTMHRLNAGRLGVEMFFVLSGRLMAEILFVREAALPSFYVRRVSRIAPALIVATLGIFGLSRIGPIGRVDAAQLLAGLTLTYNYAQLWIGRAPPLDHLWSLCIEEHVYLLLGTLALFGRRMRLRPLPVLAALIVAAWGGGLWLTLQRESYYEVYWRSDVRGASILVGAALYLWLRDFGNKRAVPSWLPVLCGCGGVVLSIDAVPDPVKYSLGTLALAGCVCLLRDAPAFVRRTLGCRPLTGIGLASFSIYLWQQPFHELHRTGWGRSAAIGGVLVCAAASYAFVEAPARRALNRMFHAYSGRRSRASVRSHGNGRLISAPDRPRRPRSRSAISARRPRR